MQPCGACCRLRGQSPLSLTWGVRQAAVRQPLTCLREAMQTGLAGPTCWCPAASWAVSTASDSTRGVERCWSSLVMACAQAVFQGGPLLPGRMHTAMRRPSMYCVSSSLSAVCT